jgi:hypothetical protein
LLVKKVWVSENGGLKDFLLVKKVLGFQNVGMKHFGIVTKKSFWVTIDFWPKESLAQN